MKYVLDSRVGFKTLRLYLALAEREGCELVTSNEKLIRKIHGQFSFVVHLASLP
jgi:hypothetical protein